MSKPCIPLDLAFELGDASDNLTYIISFVNAADLSSLDFSKEELVFRVAEVMGRNYIGKGKYALQLITDSIELLFGDKESWINILLLADGLSRLDILQEPLEMANAMYSQLIRILEGEIGNLEIPETERLLSLAALHV